MDKIEFGDKKKALVILVGPPASGKSTWGKEFAQKNNLVYVSTDSIRAEIGSGEADQSVSAAAWGIANRRVSTALAQDKSVVIDATNINRKTRKQWIKLGNAHSAFIIAVAFEIPKNVSLQRNANRERKVDPETIDRFYAKYQSPTEDEVDKVVIKRS